VIFIEKNIARFQTAVDHLKLYRNVIPNTIPVTAIAFAVGAHQTGRTEKTHFSETLQMYNLAILRSFDTVVRTNPKGAAMHGCFTFINVSISQRSC
jgi:hypothetical protein